MADCACRFSKTPQDQDKRKVAQVTEAFLEMKKLDIESLEKACSG
jgi:hypothetical protein